MSSSGDSSARSILLVAATGPASPISPREDRKRTVAAVTSNDEAVEPSPFVQIRGPPVALSGVRRPSTNTFIPFFTYWLQTSACLPQVETQNQIVSLICSPLPVVYCRLVATENEVTAWPEGV